MAKKETENKEETKAADAKDEKAAKKKAPAKKAAPKKAAAKKEDAKKEAPKKEKAAPKAKKEETKKEEAVKDLKDLGDAVKAEEAKEAPEAAKQADDKPAPRVQKLDKHGRAYATGRRKDAVARVWIKPGTGKVTVNGRDQAVYFARHTQRLVLNQPFLIVNSVGKFDVMCTVKGGGLSGQAGAVRHGITRALENFDPEMRPALKKAGMITRDSRIVERKKVGKHKARRTKQWAKR